MKRWGRSLWMSVPIAAALMFAFNCGGGGGGSDVTSPEYDIIGTYRLTGFDIDFYDYDTLDYLFSLDEDDADSFSGTMKIGLTTISQTVTIEGETFSVSDNYTITYTSGTTEGILHVTGNDIPFYISGYDIMTFASACSFELGLCWDEWDYWRKVADSLALDQEIQRLEADSAYGMGGWKGSVLVR